MPIITIRGEYGSHACEIAQEVADRLRTRLVDEEIFEQVACRLRVPLEEVCRRVDVPFQLGKRLLWQIAQGLEPTVTVGAWGPMPALRYQAAASMPLIDSRAFLEALDNTVCELADSGNLVLMGKGTQVVLRAHPEAFHVFITAPLPVRIERVMALAEINAEEARKRLAEADDYRRGFVKWYFKADVRDAALYDLVINTGKVSIETAVDTIIRLACEAC